jgi:hypothetical protein
LRFVTLCIKHAVTYSIINFFIGIISEAMIKYSYEAGKLLSKVMSVFFSFLAHVPPNTQTDLQMF